MMLNKTFYLLLLSLIPIFGFSQANSQYPDSGNKIRLGFQTTGDGLIWRDTQPNVGIYQPINNKAAWIILDTMNNKFYHYKNSTWTLAGGQDIDTANLIATKYNLGFKLSLADTQNMLTSYWRSGRFSGVLPVENGGTGSGTKNFVDLTTTQSIGGDKTFTSNISINTSGQSRTISTFYPPGSDGNNIFIGGGGNSSTTGGGASFLGSYNSAIGANALLSNTTGYNNSAIGLDALRKNTTGYYNSAIGAAALQENTSGNSNSAIGANALLSNTTGFNNAAIGRNALYSNTSGNSNSAIGVDALYSNTTGFNNAAIGRHALYSNTTGYYNSAFGVTALDSNTTGYYNSAFGVTALYSNTTGYYNAALGVDALYSNKTGYHNAALGVTALYSNTTGNSNSALGKNAGYGTGPNANITGSNNTFIGNEAVGESASESNRTWIGNTSTVSTWVGGNLLVGTRTNGTARLQVKGSGVTSSTTALKVDNNGNTNLLTVLDNGNVGIGMTTDNGARLQVSGEVRISGVAEYLRSVQSGTLSQAQTWYASDGTTRRAVFGFRSGGSDNFTLLNERNGSMFIGTNDATNITIASGGNVGIGTISPSALLHVSQASANTVFRLGNNTTYDQFIYFNGNNDWSLGMDYSNSNAFVLSNASSIGTNDRVVVTTGGNVGIGTTSPQSGYRLHVVDSVYVGGNVSASAYTTRSDYDLKDEIQNISYGINEVMQMQPVKYTYKSNGSTQLGFIAQDLGVITPEVVSFEDKMSVYYNAIIPILTKAIQEQQALIKALEQRIINLENK